MTMISIPRPHPAQRRVISEAQRFNVLDCGRRWGKTQLGINRLITPETLAHPVGWFSPTYKMLLEVWREIVRLLAPITSRSSSQERRIELTTGGVVEFWSLDNPDSARGRKYRRVVIDEAAVIPYLLEAWNMVIRSTLADYIGDAWILSTPKGRNGFWQMYQWGLDPALSEWTCWTMPTHANPYINNGEIEAMRDTMPERIYQQEIMAQFLEDAGGVFRNVAACATAEIVTEGHYQTPHIIGVDWGKLNDFTVFTVLNAESKEVVFLDRFNQIDYTIQKGRLMALCGRYNVTGVIAESNSMGEPLIDDLKREGLPMIPFQTNNTSKQLAIDALALAFEQMDIKIPNDPVLIGELQAYEAQRLPSGMLRYSAPEGLHDDMVMSLALAWQGIAKQYPAPKSVSYKSKQL